MKIKIAIFASGNGTNAEEIIKHFQNHKTVKVALILSNNPNAYVLRRAENHKIPHFIFNRETYQNRSVIDEVLRLNAIDFIVLAGFMWLMPERFVKNFPNKIINIHPALLPKYGGKGMYGNHVHEAVVKNKEKESGITIHWVNEEYDKGSIIKQVKCTVSPLDTADDVASKVHQLEYEYYPKVIEDEVFKITKK